MNTNQVFLIGKIATKISRYGACYPYYFNWIYELKRRSGEFQRFLLTNWAIAAPGLSIFAAGSFLGHSLIHWGYWVDAVSGLRVFVWGFTGRMCRINSKISALLVVRNGACTVPDRGVSVFSGKPLGGDPGDAWFAVGSSFFPDEALASVVRVPSGLPDTAMWLFSIMDTVPA